jgi:hypothetical protein
MRNFLLWASVPFALAAASFAADPPELSYTSQDSATTGWHSGIYVEGSKFIFDTQFAKLVNDTFATKPNEAGFAFMQCYGGGMIDELVALNLPTVSFTSSARADQKSYCSDRDTEFFPGTNQSLYNQRWSPVAGTATVSTLKDAAIKGRKLDLAGPFEDKKEDPQYTSSGAAGDAIALHRDNAQLATKSDKYRAILFGGFEEKREDQIEANFNSLVRIHDDLKTRGFAESEMYIMYQGGKTGKDPKGDPLPDWIDDNTTAAAVKRAFKDYKDNATATTQFLYWSGPNHGGRTNDEVKMRANAAALSGAIYPYNVTPDFLDELHETYDFFASDPIEGQSVRVPYYFLTADEDVSNLQLALNGHALTRFSISDVFDDGSQYYYKFLLSQSDMAGLSSSNQISYTWAGGPGQLDVEIGGLIGGDSPNSVPEPSSAIAVAALAGFALARSRRTNR